MVHSSRPVRARWADAKSTSEDGRTPPVSFTPSLDKIEKAGRQNPVDRRSVKVILTTKGESLRDEVIEGADRIDNKLCQEFSDKH